MACLYPLKCLHYENITAISTGYFGCGTNDFVLNECSMKVRLFTHPVFCSGLPVNYWSICEASNSQRYQSRVQSM